MRIEGFVPVDGEIVYWDWSAPREIEVAVNGGYTTVESMVADGWKIIRVGDVDSIRDDELEEAAEHFESYGGGVTFTGAEVAEKLRCAMKSKP